ncbi:DUF952 domain-containing protein [Kordiimonas marina]|uniref:DUF952 domain-containing protein n=1 Tax=Kordiimonas marina TaxID=2872312 RepID=UPI001FF480B9|nr:DUF952 domain-containing protein [Kordiimonas marina]MCJ9429905.1 DUF952 domain-containing protein [Kordiimonas marina]
MRAQEWQEAKSAAFFEGAPVDHADGFIHFSTAAQVAETARLHFAGVAPLHVLAVDPWKLPVGQLKWEASRGGEDFPHLYGPLPMAAVAHTWALEPDANGNVDFVMIEEAEADD